MPGIKIPFLRIATVLVALPLATGPLCPPSNADETATQQHPFDARPQAWERRDAPVLSAYSTKQSWCKVVVYSPHVIRLPDQYLLYYSARDMKTTFVDKQGRKGKDGAGIYAHIGVAVPPKQ